MLYKLLFCSKNKQNIHVQSIFAALLGLLLWSSKSQASELSLEPNFIYDCLTAKCLTLDTNHKPLKEDRVKLDRVLRIDVNNTEILYPNIWLGQGIDLLDPVPSQKNFSLYFAGKTFRRLTVSSVVEHGLKKENPQAMLNQVNVWRAGPSLYWKVSKNAVIYSSALWGKYSDGNQNLQTYSRIDQNFGSFSLSADLSTASYEQDLETSSGYFSPSRYLLYSAEAAWKQNMTDASSCKLAFRAGKQKLSAASARVYSVATSCAVAVFDRTNINVNYSLANVDGTESETYHGFTGTAKLSF